MCFGADMYFRIKAKTGGAMKFMRLIFVVTVFFIPFSLSGATSAENRGDSLFFLGMTPVGAHVPTILTRPYNVGIYLGRSFMFGYEYGMISDSDYEHTYLNKKYDSENSGDETNVTGSYTNEGFYARVFADDSSLNLYLAYHIRTWDGEGTLTKDSGDAEAEMTFQTTVASLGIGNMWLFDSGFTLGLNWYIDSRIVGQNIDYTINSNTGIPESDVEEEIEDFGKFLNAVSGLFGFVTVTVGLSF